MGRLGSPLRAFALTDPAPTPLLEALNDVLVFYAPDQFATLVYVLVDLTAGTARMATAGHPPAVRLRADGGAELLPDGRGVLLGFTPSRMCEAEVALVPVDALVLYTDGLVERRGEPLDGGLERLRAVAEGIGGPDGRGSGPTCPPVAPATTTPPCSSSAARAEPTVGGGHRRWPQTRRLPSRAVAEEDVLA